MTFNRLVDQTVDAANPRTSNGALPEGRLSRRFTWLLTGLSSGLLLAAVAAAAGLIRQHRLVSADDLSAVDAAFLTANGMLAVIFGALFVIARILDG
jgi:4-hydroxybenzoate polyprenyltransferase